VTSGAPHGPAEAAKSQGEAEESEAMDEEAQQAFRDIRHAFEASAEFRRLYYAAYAKLFDPGEVVLDLGCGDGLFLLLLREQRVRGVGVERDPSRAASARAHGLTLIHIIEHFPPMDIFEVLWHLTQKCKPNKALIVTPNFANPVVQESFWFDVTHVRPYPAPLLTVLWRRLGFGFVQTGLGADQRDVFAYGRRTP
jgi:SAM-dependent methyltransferase